MSDLISRKETIKYIRENLPLSTFMHRGVNQADIACWDVCNMIAVRVPSAEPVRKKGKWNNYKDEHSCSVCQSVVIQENWDDDIRYDYCPYCGAEMMDDE